MEASEPTRDDRPATVIVDREGVIHQWSDAVTGLVGYTSDETLGRSLDVVIPRPLRPLHWWGFDRAMKRGRMSDRPLKVPALCRDGSIVVAHATIELIHGEGGRTDGAAVNFIGTGARWQGTAWRAALAPANLAGRLFGRARSHD
jgi:PAS domain S-box-containing protein